MRLGRKVIASAVPPNLTENLSARLDLAVRSPGAFVFPRYRLTPAAGSLCCVLREKYSFRVVTQSVFYLRVDHRQHKVKGQGEI